MNDITINSVASGRTAYQVVPDPNDPIILQIEGKLTRVLDVSANGFTLPADVVTPGRRYPFSLDLPTGQAPVSGYVDALPQKGNDEVQCLFVNLVPEETDAIHQYVLIRQKEAIRSIRAAKSGNV